MSLYSPAAVFASEAAAMTLTIYLGNAVIANELLASTKGRQMGWGFVALGYAFAFATGILTFGYISAHLNPAVCLSLLILGKIGGTEFAAAVAGEFLGAFLGACLVWLHYVVHFKTVPEPPSSRPEDLLLRSRDAMDATALGIASYTTKEEDVQARQRGLGDLRNVLADIKFYLSDMHPSPPDSDEELVRVALGPDQMRQSAQDLVGSLRRRSVQVGDVHRRLKDYDMQKFKALMALPHVQSFAQMASTGNAHLMPHSPSIPHGLPHSQTMPQFSNANKEVNHGHNHHHDHHPVVASHQQRLDRLYDQAVIADANAKLSVFCTRPALYSPLFNFITEFLCTTALVFGALMIYARRDQLYGPERTLFRAIEGLVIGFFVFVVILGLGGPTGIAANPARDLSPRIAHALLPIPGKGPSEFYYSWIPVLAPLCGGCASAGFYAAVQLLNNSNVPGNDIFPAAAVTG